MVNEYNYQSALEEDNQTAEDYKWELWRAEQLLMQQDGEQEIVIDMEGRSPQPLNFN